MADSGAKGRLILVGTPIGNLSDMSPRAEGLLGEADIVMAEDTRRTARFVKQREKLYSYHDHNTRGRLPQIIEFLERGMTVALVSDAGMPGISDPAFRAVRAAVEGGFHVGAVPGPSAVVMAVAVSGLPTDRFAFEGFLPRKKGARRSKIQEMSGYPGSIVYYIGPHHLLKYSEEMVSILGNRPACVCRELTKVHEEIVRGGLRSIPDLFSGRKVRGEITLVVGGAGLSPDLFD